MIYRLGQKQTIRWKFVVSVESKVERNRMRTVYEAERMVAILKVY